MPLADLLAADVSIVLLVQPNGLNVHLVITVNLTDLRHQLDNATQAGTASITVITQTIMMDTRYIVPQVTTVQSALHTQFHVLQER